MKITKLQSIEKVDQVYQTGCKPLLVHCSDLQFYVCKYSIGKVAANLLFREWMNAAFLRLWKLQIPTAQLVHLQKKHKPQSVHSIQTDMPCFGLLYQSEYREVDAFMSNASGYQLQKFGNKMDLLKIALFDIWIGNDDRNSNNYNLLLKMENDQYHFVPIDGGAVFHTGNQDKEHYPLSPEESLMTSPLVSNMFTKKDITDRKLFATLEKDYYLCIASCKVALQKTIAQLPDEWLINKPLENKNLELFLFNEEWIKETWKTFIEYTQMTLNRK